MYITPRSKNALRGWGRLLAMNDFMFLKIKI
jgi:hypothetical protein